MLLSVYIILIILSFSLQSLIFPHFIIWCAKWQKGGQPIRDCGPETHINKKGTPTMGGLGIILIISLMIIGLGIIQKNFAKNIYIIACMFIFLSYGIIGFIDDYRKIKSRTSKGLTVKSRLLLQLIISLLTVIFIKAGDYGLFSCGKFSFATLTDFFYSSAENKFKGYNINFPLGFSMNLGLFYYAIAPLVIVGTANAVNLTDGLDGLVSFPLIMSFIFFSVAAFIAAITINDPTAIADISRIIVNNIGSNIDTFSSNKNNFNISDESYAIGYLCAIAIGSCLSFLWYNCQPARIFMGDVGSLSLGGMVGAMAICFNLEIGLVFVGALFVLEALSVIIQVTSFRLRQKRIFLMAPIHHHFEKMGWAESRVVIRFWIFSIFCTLLGIFLFFAI